MRQQLSHHLKKGPQESSSTEASDIASESPAIQNGDDAPKRPLPPLYRPMVTRAETLDNEKTKERLSVSHNPSILSQPSMIG